MRRIRWVGVAVVVVAAALGVFLALRPELPGPCGHVLEEPRGELRDDAAVLGTAWAALTDPDARTIGDLDGSRPTASRTCLLYAGVLDGTAAPTVVLVETTVSGDTDLLRIAEVRLPAREGDAAQLAVTGMPVLLGSELGAGLLLPLSGAYLAPARDVVDITGVRVVRADGTTGPLPAIGDGVYAPGIAPDRTLAPADQVPDTGAVFILSRDAPYGDRAVALPAPGAHPDRTVPRRAFRLYADDSGTAGSDEEAALTALAAALPTLAADPTFGRLLDRWPPHPALVITPGPGGFTVAAAEPARGLPVFPIPAVG